MYCVKKADKFRMLIASPIRCSAGLGCSFDEVISILGNYKGSCSIFSCLDKRMKVICMNICKSGICAVISEIND